MKKLFTRVLALVLPFGLANGTETAIWDTANNTVKYTVASTFGMNTPTSVSLSQFDSAAVAGQEGGGSFVLSKVVLTLNGSLSTVLTYNNTTAASQSVSVQSMAGGSYFTYAPLNITSGTENYDISYNFGTVASGTSVTAGDPNPIIANGTGPVSSGDITSDLSSFLGNGSISTVVNFGLMGWVWGAEGTKSEQVTRTADMTVTYYYDAVPEPSSLALLGFGSAVLLLRRRRSPR